MKLDAARLLLWRAASTWDQMNVGIPPTRILRPYNGDRSPSQTNDPLRSSLLELVRESESAQHQAVEFAKSATIDAVQIMGGAGFMQDHPVEMWMRNAAAMD
jgi:alkylation response protein AidB-like acyl-CoA dehydrogenase